jgi:hypothetical protein
MCGRSRCSRLSHRAVGATLCATCSPGSVDHDSNSSTPCELCTNGTENQKQGSTNISDCTLCVPGRWSSEAGERGARLELRNVSSELRNVSLELRNVRSGPHPPYRKALLVGTASCARCPEGSYRGAQDPPHKCIRCDTAGQSCEEVHPHQNHGSPAPTLRTQICLPCFSCCMGESVVL